MQLDRDSGDMEILVDLEEVTHLVKSVNGKLVDVLVLVVVGVVEGDGNDLFVVSAVVDHGDNSDGVSSHQRKGLDGLGAEQKHVEGVSVITQRAGNESVVCRVVGGGEKDAVENDKSRLLVKLVLLAASLGDFHNANEILGGYSFWRYVVPDV